MTTINNISIPKPCSESWEQMTPAGQGRHCQSCCKRVTDFTGMSNKQIIDYMAHTNHVCGRFSEQQVRGINYQLYADNLPATGGWKKMGLALSLIGTGFSLKTSAQIQTVAVEQTPVTKIDLRSKYMITDKTPADSTVYRIITGRIVDERNEALPGVMINVPADQIGTLTDMNGNFRLRIPNTVTQFTASFIGYNSQSVNVDMKSSYPLELKMQAMLMGEVVIAKRAPFVKRVYYRFIKRPIRKIFN